MRGNLNCLDAVCPGCIHGSAGQQLPPGATRRVNGSQRASPAAECCCGSGKIVLEKTRTAVCAGEEPEPLVAALPRGSREKRAHRRAGALPGQQTAEEIPPRAEECHQS